jgi:hypothetical protein
MGIWSPKTYWKDVSPTGAIGDLIHEFRRPNPYRWQILGVSVAATFTMLMLFIPESQHAPPAKPKITYISTFRPDRTDAEIAASNLANEKRQQAIRAEEQARIERRKQFFRTLGRSTGLDVDALEKQFADDPPAKSGPAATPSPAPQPAGGR